MEESVARARRKGSHAAVAAFLRGVGIEVRVGDPGQGRRVSVDGGCLVVEGEDDTLSGEMLKRAGRIAVLPGRFRHMAGDRMAEAEAAMGGYVDTHPDGFRDPEDPVLRACLQAGDEEGAAWAYAAAVAAGVDTRLPFGGRVGAEVHEMLGLNAHPGVNGLQAAGMTSVRAKPGRSAFPAMSRWLAVD